MGKRAKLTTEDQLDLIMLDANSSRLARHIQALQRNTRILDAGVTEQDIRRYHTMLEKRILTTLNLAQTDDEDNVIDDFVWHVADVKELFRFFAEYAEPFGVF